ncbi:hypothetical protein [Micromonospora sp. SH-82]|uniref:hypothetical protein n=1 Tax=Micromonospora sp. SH-82 TaxID=3132938 RepID=UPI003EC0D98C
MTDHPTPDWSPVVFGRTRHADAWWRAVPAGLTGVDWLTDVVHATVNNGRRIDDGPRFALAQVDAGVLVGVACRATELSEEFGEQAGRRLYTFVGWVGPVRAAAQIPPLSAWRDRWRDWTRTTYHDWLRIDWDRPARTLHTPHESTPGLPGWVTGPPSVGTAEATAPAAPTPASRGTVWLLPAGHADAGWETVRRGAGPAVHVVAGDHRRNVLLDGVTHVYAGDVPEPHRHPTPTEPATEPHRDPAPPPAAAEPHRDPPPAVGSPPVEARPSIRPAPQSAAADDSEEQVEKATGSETGGRRHIIHRIPGLGWIADRLRLPTSDTARSDGSERSKVEQLGDTTVHYRAAHRETASRAGTPDLPPALRRAGGADPAVERVSRAEKTSLRRASRPPVEAVPMDEFFTEEEFRGRTRGEER